MNRQELFQKLSAILDEAERGRTYGVVEFELRDGKIVLLRTIKTEKIEYRGNASHASQQTHR